MKVTIQQGVAKELVVRSQQMEDPASLKSKDLMSILCGQRLADISMLS